ncbi:unnamed protein product [Didymodactylos carnosus]|uniref:ABC transporter domain-containing protein n=1 Tax=Didymodactylos carnosus TaxID=1234261 RepID=A0A8S2H8V0_9BILA|nr:unnamed protein product [Didymodactylos carnosus]CAF3609646.1 unnamed protein product [Didymodactylos carnosus]
MDQKYESSISQNAKNLSGGQKQRIAIARAIYKKPEIYVFDDSFSALDYKTDKNLRADLKKVTHSATTIIVGQRIATIKDADQIIVIDEGEISAIGKHRDLLVSSAIYRDIASSQLSAEELAND